MPQVDLVILKMGEYLKLGAEAGHRKQKDKIGHMYGRAEIV